MKNRYEYTIELPNKTNIKIWFIGEVIEKILNAYNIPYTKKRK